MAIPNQNKSPAGKVTAKGTAYTEYEILVPATNDLMLALVPNATPEGAQVRTVGYSHGRGATRTQINSGAHIPLRDELLDAGYVVWSGDYGFNAWSSQGAVEKITAAQAWVDAQWAVTHRFLAGESMGGSLVAYVAGKKPFHVDGFFFIFPSVSLRKAWKRDQWGYRDEMVQHFGISPDGSDFDMVTEPYDPAEFPASDYAGIKAKVYTGTKDAIVSLTEVVEPWFNKMASVSDSATLTTTDTGHGAAENLPPEVIRDWFNSLSQPKPGQDGSGEPGAPVAISAIQAWNGSQWVQAEPKQFDGTAWVSAMPTAYV